MNPREDLLCIGYRRTTRTLLDREGHGYITRADGQEERKTNSVKLAGGGACFLVENDIVGFRELTISTENK